LVFHSLRLPDRLVLALAAALALPGTAAAATAPNATVVEYYRAGVDHYFMTASPQEQRALDDGVQAGWARTGVTFLAWTDPAKAPATARPVCRYYGRPEAGLDSHFYSAFGDECDAVAVQFPTAWQFESPAVFYVEAPDRATGACPPGTDPVYRAYDNRGDANHRYMVDAALRATMLARGWIAEGYGPQAVVMCAPSPATSAQDVALSDPAFYSTSPGASLAGPVESAAVTHHAIVVGGTTLRYTATAGHLTARDPATGAPEAAFFYVAYTADGTDAATRPVTFFYNGGPGSATVWLHLGSFGPKRLATAAPSTTTPRPFPLVDNAETLLDTTDLVFVDAIGAGLSEAIAPLDNRSFFGVDKDAAAFRDFIARYVEVNARQASPKYLFGESYGTTRSGVLAHLLETAGVALDGVILQSSVLDYNANCGVVNVPTINCAGYLPTYASTGAWYGLVAPPPVDLAAFRLDVQAFAINTYAPAVPPFVLEMMLPAQPVIDTLVADTGIRESTWRTRFNLDPDTFQHRLLPSAITGRYDARMSAPIGSPLAAEDDPSSTFISPGFGGAILAYLQGPLKYAFPVGYTTLGNAIAYWDFSHDGRGLPDVVPDLAAALALDPSLRVLSVNGFHDLATPYYQTMLDLSRLGATPRVQVRNYDGGHMTYLDDGSRVRMKADLRAFYRAAAPRAAAGVEP
jgi:carboxypeptidase C (cathepsin A)